MKSNYKDSEIENAASALIDQMGASLEAALVSVESANTRICEELSARGDSNRRSVIINNVKQECAANPGWLDAVVEFMSDPDHDEKNSR